MKERDLNAIGFRVEHLDTVGSTNTYLKQQAALGAPHGLVVTATEQTGGRGRFGRSFLSAKGKGLYLSVLLRPDFSAPQAAELTSWAAVAVCRAVEALTGLRPAIKWINDILLDGKKLCGILTEADIASDGSLNHIIIGIGLNIYQTDADFTPEVAAIATSLAQHLAQPPSREELTSGLLQELNRMWQDFPAKQTDYLAAYRSRCTTVGKQVNVISPAGTRSAFVLGIDENFALRVRFSDGSLHSLDSGEVSVRNTSS